MGPEGRLLGMTKESEMRIENSNIVTAFGSEGVIGSKVEDHAGFLAVLYEAIKGYDFAGARVPGQGFIELGDRVNSFVSAGVGKRVDDPTAYVVNTHRGRCTAYLKRTYAAKVTGCACVVYTMDAYKGDPEVSADEVASLEKHGATHILVAVLAFAGPQSPLSPFRFTSNLAGGNKEAQVWTADEIRAKAKEIYDYDTEWCAVADPVV